MDSNSLYYGDTLDMLGRHIADESVDLVSLITSAMRFIWQRRPGMSRAVQSSVRVGVSTDSMLFYVRSVLMGMTFATHERIWRRQSPGFSESWRHDRISDDPSVLGLGELDVLERERVQHAPTFLRASVYGLRGRAQLRSGRRSFSAGNASRFNNLENYWNHANDH